ncbi:MAG: Hsp20/alpha crystallin family protein, partial [Planctomycetota bacterium]
MSDQSFGQGGSFDDWSRKMHDILEEMLKRSFVDFRDCGAWRPATNVYESSSAFYVCVDLAGVEIGEITVECLSSRHIRISGVRRKPLPVGESEALSIHALEIDEGPFAREINLPEPIVVDAVEA